MQRHPVALWFRPKSFGYGWTPATWEGWLVTGLAVVVVVVVAGWAGP
jgi:hypothetical protein